MLVISLILGAREHSLGRGNETKWWEKHEKLEKSESSNQQDDEEELGRNAGCLDGSALPPSNSCELCAGGHRTGGASGSFPPRARRRCGLTE